MKYYSQIHRSKPKGSMPERIEKKPTIQYYIISIGIIILGLGIRDNFSGSELIDPLGFRIGLFLLSFFTFIGFYKSKFVAKNINSIFVTLFLLVNIWLYFLLIVNDFSLRYLYSLIASILANSFIFKSKKLLFPFLILNILIFLLIGFIYQSQEIYNITPLLVSVALAVGFITNNQINVREDLLAQTREMDDLNNQLLGLDTAIEENNNGVIFTNENGLIINCNKHFLNGRKLDDVAKKVNYKEYVIEKSFNDVENAINDVFENKISSKFEVQLLNNEGNHKWLEINITKLENEGSQIQFIIIEQDFTNEKVYQKELEGALERIEKNNYELQESLHSYENALIEIKRKDLDLTESEAQLKAVLNANPDLIFISDYDGVFIDVFTHNENQLMVPKDEIFGRTLEEILPKEVYDIISVAYQKVIKSSKLQVVNYSIPSNVENQTLIFEARLSSYTSNKVLTIVRDITSEENLKNEIVNQKEFVNKIATTTPNFIYLINSTTNKIIYSNRSVEELFGYTNQEIEKLENGIQSIFLPGFSLVYKTSIDELCDPNNPKDIVVNEFEIITKSGERKWVKLITKVFKVDSDGNAIELLTVSEDITKLKKTQLELIASQKFFDNIMSESPFVIAVFESNNNILFASNAIKEITGYNLKELNSKENGFVEIIHKDYLNLYFNNIEELKNGTERQKFELVIIDNNNEERWIELDVTTFQVLDGNIAQLLVIFQDLTDLKIEQKKFEESEKRWQYALEGAGDGIWNWNLKTNEVYFSKQWKQMLGYDESEIDNLISEWVERIHPEEKEDFNNSINYHIEGKSSSYVSEHRILTKSGEYIWVLDRGKVIEFDSDGKPCRMIGTHTNINDWINAQKRIEEAEERWKFAIDGSGDGIWDWNIETGDVFYSEVWKKMLGFNNDEIPNDFIEWERLVHPNDKENATTLLSKYLASEIPSYQLEYRMLTKDGNYKWILTRGKIIEKSLDGEPLRMIGTHTDIDVRVNQEKQIRKNQIRFQKIVENISGIFWIKDITNNKMNYMSPNYESIWGSSVDAIMKDPEDFTKPIHPEDIGNVYKAYQQIFEGKDFNQNYRIVVNDKEKWIWARTRLVEDEDGNLFDYGYAEDITDIKNYEIELEQRSDELHLTQEMAKIGGWSVDLIYGTVKWSDQVRKIHEENIGYEPTLAEGINFYIEEHQPIISDAVQNTIETGNPWDLELQILTKTGKQKWIRTIGLVVYDETGNPIKLTGAFQDIDEKRRTQEEQTRIFNLSIDMIAVSDFNGYFKQLNKAWENTLGWTQEELMAVPYTDFVHPDDLNITSDAEDTLMDENNPIMSFENRYKTKSGEYRWLSWNALPIPGQGLIYAIARDVTDEKNQTEKLQQYAEELNMAQLMAKVGGWKVDLVGAKVIWSEQVKLIHEVDMDYVPSLETGINFYVPEHRPIITKIINESIVNLTNWDVELQILTAKGNRKWVRAIGKPIEKEGKVTGLTGTFQDVDENKRAQEEKNKIFDLSIDMICVAGFDGYFKQLNEAWSENLGWEKDELLSTSFMSYIHPDDIENTENAIVKLNNGQTLISFENRMRSNLGEYRWLSWNALSTPDEGLMYAISRDITDEKQQNYDLKKAKEVAESANKAKSAFLANMSHEIRTPMNAILGFGDLLKNELVNSEQIQFVNSIINSGKNLLTLINDILDLSKIEAGKLTIQYEKMNLAEFLKEIQQIFSLKASEKNLNMEIVYNSEIPNFIDIDEIRLRQILFNLIGNAIKFTETGGIYLIVEAKEIQDDVHRLSIGVKDTGIGIPEDQTSKIFQSFTQQDNQSTRKFGGTGLGLTITKKLVEMLNGDINVTSQFGEGSTFTVEFNEVKTYKTGTLVKETNNYNNVNFGTGKVLIAEDIEENFLLMKTILTKQSDLEIHWAKDGLEAIQQAPEIMPDLVLMDIQMPVMDGIEASQKMKQQSSTKNIPIVALTALAMNENKDKYSKYFDGYLTKPIDRVQLNETLSRYFEVIELQETKSVKPKGFTQDEIEYISSFKDELEKLTVTFELDTAIEKIELMIEETGDFSTLNSRLNKILDFAESFDIDGFNKDVKSLINSSIP
ncbi:PAS domain-containing protein [Candidatus Kapabacteria bacterium]|nr:PAS domain-containing protein [Candidatus Kapabacteria bacterium]